MSKTKSRILAGVFVCTPLVAGMQTAADAAGIPFTGHTEFLAELCGGHPVMMLAAGQGSTLSVQIEGEDEIEALAALRALIDDYFGEGE